MHLFLYIVLFFGYKNNSLRQTGVPLAKLLREWYNVLVEGFRYHSGAYRLALVEQGGFKLTKMVV